MSFRPGGNFSTALNGTPHCAFSYDETTEKVSFRVRDDSPCEIKVNLPWELYIKLGFSLVKSSSTWVKSGEEGPHVADLYAGTNALFVYTDIVEESRILANTLGPLIRIVPFQGRHGKTIHWEPQRVEYCRLRYDYIDEIKIDVRNDAGELFKFLSGKITVTLHIKEIS